jgi:hypothetical protein
MARRIDAPAGPYKMRNTLAALRGNELSRRCALWRRRVVPVRAQRHPHCELCTAAHGSSVAVATAALVLLTFRRAPTAAATQAKQQLHEVTRVHGAGRSRNNQPRQRPTARAGMAEGPSEAGATSTASALDACRELRDRLK